MKVIRTLFLMLTTMSSTLHAEICSVSEEDILGAWSREGEQGFFEEFSLATYTGSNDFSSWIHHKPEISGAVWEVKDCRLLITARHNEFTPFQLKILELKRDQIYLHDGSENSLLVYRRIRAVPEM